MSQSSYRHRQINEYGFGTGTLTLRVNPAEHRLVAKRPGMFNFRILSVRMRDGEIVHCLKKNYFSWLSITRINIQSGPKMRKFRLAGCLKAPRKPRVNVSRTLTQCGRICAHLAFDSTFLTLNPT